MDNISMQIIEAAEMEMEMEMEMEVETERLAERVMERILAMPTEKIMAPTSPVNEEGDNSE